MRQDPVVHFQHAAFALVLLREVYIVADVDVDAVVIDWIHDLPVKRLLPGSNIMVHLLQAAIGNRNQAIGHGYTDLHSAIRFVRPVIFIGPPNARPDSLGGRDNEILSEIVSSPGYSTDPGRILTYHRNSFVKHFDRVFDS